MEIRIQRSRSRYYSRGSSLFAARSKITYKTQNHIIEFKKVVAAGTNENLNLFVLQQAKQCLHPEGSSWYSEHRGCVLSLQILSAFWVSLTLYRRPRSMTFIPAPLLHSFIIYPLDTEHFHIWKNCKSILFL